MARQKICILPKLYDGNGDLKKKWFINFSYRNPRNNKMTRFRVFEGFGILYTKGELIFMICTRFLQREVSKT